MRSKRSRFQNGSIRKVKRATGHAWEVRFSETVEGQRKQKSLYFSSDEYPTEASVRRVIQTQVTLANNRNERHKVTAQFGAIIALYRTEHLPTLRHSTKSTNAYLIDNYLEPQFFRTPVKGVTPRDVMSWLTGLKLAATTKAAIRSILSQCFELAALHGYIPATERNPISLVKIKGTSKRQKVLTVLTPDQFKSLVAALPAPYNVMVLLTGVLGLRVGELLALHWSDISWTDKTITIQRNFTRQMIGEVKTDASRAVLPLDDSLIAILQPYQKTTGDSELLFPSPRNGSYRSGGMIMSKNIQPIATQLKMGRIGWHQLRHSCRSWLLRRPR
jgi:integrase